MQLPLIILFVLGYLAIALEEPLRVNKAAPALLAGALMWAAIALIGPAPWFISTPAYSAFASLHPLLSGSALYGGFLGHALAEHLVQASEILFFVMGAMVIVELIDAHRGFQLITERIGTRKPMALLVAVACITFVLSAMLDNLTSTIVMVSLLKKLIAKPSLRMYFVGMVVIAANAGGAWSPIGDITTTMLWIGGQITIGSMIAHLLLPSLVCLGVPLLVLGKRLGKQDLGPVPQLKDENQPALSASEQQIMFWLGLGALLFVPIFKGLTGLPPYMGMLLSLGLVWLVSELLHSSKDQSVRSRFSASAALQRIDTSAILFFLGILLCVGALQTYEVLQSIATFFDSTLRHPALIAFAIGISSAIIDNVPLVAAAIGMYPLASFPADSVFWHALAYSAGTGGSMLIIGSAAGVAAMSLEHISFLWYLRHIGWLAAIGYVAGMAVFLLMGAV